VSAVRSAEHASDAGDAGGMRRASEIESGEGMPERRVAGWLDYEQDSLRLRRGAVRVREEPGRQVMVSRVSALARG
jgi:hypothetical protein